MSDNAGTDNINLKDLDIRIITSAPLEELKTLYKDAGWWDAAYGEHPEFLVSVPRDSALFAGAFYKKKLIGMGRALSDRTSDAYIQDVVVLNTYRGLGIGSKIIKVLIRELMNLGVDWIGLIGEPGTQSFYERLGFKEMKDHIPFKLEG
ncbi:MAG: GNAT family N-acetyltransferase [Desulfobacterales bacterium]|nr:GNAT family N-acetyltransferase [Desulfobacterales bacterium]